VVGAHDVLAGELVQTMGEPFRQPATVGEDDRAAVLPDELEDAWMDRRPDAGPEVAPAGLAAGLLVEWQDLAETAHVLDRHHDLELQQLARPGIDDGHLPTFADPAQETGDRLERPLGGREPDALERRRPSGTERFESLEAQREMGTAF